MVKHSTADRDSGGSIPSTDSWACGVTVAHIICNDKAADQLRARPEFYTSL